jgi:hypothetical protein
MGRCSLLPTLVTSEIVKAVQRERERIVEKLRAIFYGYDSIGAFDDALNMIRSRGDGKPCSGCGYHHPHGGECVLAKKPGKIARMEQPIDYAYSVAEPIIAKINELIDRENARG